ncbi:hypothetical protein J5U22_01687 [Saccharolobus shibatae]|uniref:Uncharacterized protein n=1 Tax=Saccharolobus shibatae TaxID=2286 RepID=A0A8F5C191_9CREN|nr:hypothetical protein J5U22_01687 [Saccharolobus shibatae]
MIYKYSDYWNDLLNWPILEELSSLKSAIPTRIMNWDIFQFYSRLSVTDVLCIIAVKACFQFYSRLSRWDAATLSTGGTTFQFYSRLSRKRNPITRR